MMIIIILMAVRLKYVENGNGWSVTVKACRGCGEKLTLHLGGSS